MQRAIISIILVLASISCSSCQRTYNLPVGASSPTTIQKYHTEQQAGGQTTSVPVSTPVSLNKTFPVNCSSGQASIISVNIFQNDLQVNANFNVKNNSSKTISIHTTTISLYNAAGEVLGVINAIGRLAIDANQFSTFTGSTKIDSRFADYLVDHIDVHIS